MHGALGIKIATWHQIFIHIYTLTTIDVFRKVNPHYLRTVVRILVQMAECLELALGQMMVADGTQSHQAQGTFELGLRHAATSEWIEVTKKLYNLQHQFSTCKMSAQFNSK